MMLTLHSDISHIAYPVGYPLVIYLYLFVPFVPSGSPKAFYVASRSHYLIWFSLALLDTDATNEGEGQPTDDVAQDEGEEQGKVIGEAEIVEAQTGTSGNQLGVVGGNVEVEDDQEEECDKDEEEVSFSFKRVTWAPEGG